jgi:hypothetical protein
LSPEQYQAKGKRSIIVRGIFDEIKVGEKVYKEDIGKLNLDYNNQKHFMVCYIERIFA